ncbi:hypothetical protein C8J56DRAFT_787403 [Mycena floridula]|nr:hypothetical protein C8J56DRAFT_787403 [Mycena floridula]
MLQQDNDEGRHPREDYLDMLDDHDESLEEAAQEGQRGRNQNGGEASEPSDDDDISTGRGRAKPDESKFAWAADELISSTILSKEAIQYRDRLENYGLDIKLTKRRLFNSLSAPAFPESQWDNILSRKAVNLDTVFSNLHTATAKRDQGINVGGSIRIVYGEATVESARAIQDHGQWIIAFDALEQAIVFVFPELTNSYRFYRRHISDLFSSIQQSAHQRIINYDKAVRNLVAMRRGLLLSDVSQFGHLRTNWIDSIGAGAGVGVATSGSSGTSRTGNRPRVPKSGEVCRNWNAGNCTKGDRCRHNHACSKCSGNHPANRCNRGD